MSPVIGHALVDGTAYLRLAGELRHDNVAALELLIEHWFGSEAPVPRALVIDLGAVDFLDSTALGLLAACLREARAHGLPQPLVFSTQADINALLRGLRFDEYCGIVERAGDAGPPVATLATSADDPAVQSSAATILRAHEALIELHEANRVAFQPVVDLFKAELR
ncbi:MAG: STAS domain-containing protein [Xanthomonadales bacterium]|nr:hypothetical protein [Xanthomonadales bacterium]MCC6591919.1 STAS domain-containing protein [Xanthomonadales bacterium]MCE7930061.1 anti-sigma factor antagonist [Xanthomonadales bacterium PRO6]